jgi:1-aminocyclopropane-1-carboxylate deaminase
MDTIDERLVKIQPLYPGWYDSRVTALDMLRLDLLHPIVSGNKWYKLRLNVMYAKDHGFKTIVTFGGGYSNHLIATAYAAQKSGLNSVGIVRGRYEKLTQTLHACREHGMQFIFVTKEDYNRKEDTTWVSDLAAHFDEIFIIPEGGANELGRKGAGLINRFIKSNYTHIAVSVGTGTTLTGIRNSIPVEQAVIGFAPMRQGSYLKEYISTHLHPGHDANWQLLDEWHFGGFGKWNDELILFMNGFHETNNIPLDIIYTSKMMYGLRELIRKDYFAETDNILCIHTGGLQGNEEVGGLMY